MAKEVEILFEQVENIVRKEENADHYHYLLFPLCFEMPSFSRCSKGSHIKVDCMQYDHICNLVIKLPLHNTLRACSFTREPFTMKYNLRLVKFKYSCKQQINPFPNNDTFGCVWERSLLKTLWEKEKLLVQAISPLPTMFSPLSTTEITIFVTFNPFPNDKFWTIPNWKSLQTIILNLMKMAESSLKW